MFAVLLLLSCFNPTQLPFRSSFDFAGPFLLTIDILKLKPNHVTFGCKHVPRASTTQTNFLYISYSFYLRFDFVLAIFVLLVGVFFFFFFLLFCSALPSSLATVTGTAVLFLFLSTSQLPKRFLFAFRTGNQ